jgi:hypothetical protein
LWYRISHRYLLVPGNSNKALADQLFVADGPCKNLGKTLDGLGQLPG